MENRSSQGVEKRETNDERNDCEPGKCEGQNGGSGHKVSSTERSTTSKPVTFNAILLCTPPMANSSSTVKSERSFTVSKIPESVAELKKAIQQEFHIPIYDQKLSFGCSVMEDSEKLDFYKIKDGDQLTIEYTATAEIESVLLFLSNLRDIRDFLNGIQNQLK